jgi:Na+/phosphate symporter
MRDKSSFKNPLRNLRNERDIKDCDVETLHTRAVSNSVEVDEGLIIIISKLVEMIRLLIKQLSGSLGELVQPFSRLAGEVHDQSQILTEALSSLRLDQQLLNRLIRFPLGLETMGHLLENILECRRTMALSEVMYIDKAYPEQEQIFTLLLDILTNLRDSLQNPSKEALLAVSFQGKHLDKMLLEFEGARGQSVKSGAFVVETSTVWREMLDSAKCANQYAMEISSNLLELGKPQCLDTHEGPK